MGVLPQQPCVKNATDPARTVYCRGGFASEKKVTALRAASLCHDEGVGCGRARLLGIGLGPGAG